jgi:hypothetical protein
MKMSKEFELLNFLLKTVECKIDSRAFAMFKEGNITIAYWDDNEKLQIVADALVYPKFEKTLFLLYQQIMNFINK